MARIPILLNPPCAHRQPATGDLVPCRPGAKCRAWVYGCVVHERCTLHATDSGLACCRECVDVQAPQVTDLPADAPPAPQVRRVLVTLNLGDVLTDHARRSHQCAAERWGSEYHEITTSVLPEGALPHWEKTTLWAWARERGYDQVVYVDADCLIRSDCPSLFDLVAHGRIGAVRNDQFPGRHWRAGQANVSYRTLRAWAERLGRPTPDLDRCVNSGVLVWWTADTESLFLAWGSAGAGCGYGKVGGYVDQAALSVLLAASPHQDALLWLPPQFNTLVWRDDLIPTAGRAPGYITHFAGSAAKGRLEMCQWDLRPVHRVTRSLATGSPMLPLTAPPLGPDVVPRDQIECVYVLGLERRRDRWDAFVRYLPADWPLRSPMLLLGVDGSRCPPPTWWTHPPGQWGCRLAHLGAIETALYAGQDSVLILEDDAELCPDFSLRLRDWLAEVPSDWELLFLGGQTLANSAVPLNDHVVIPGYTILAHAYALRGRGLTLAYQWGHEHTPARAEWDHRLAALSASGQVRAYAPREWLVYQRAGYSDISRCDRPRRGVVPPIAADQRKGVSHE